MRNEKKKLVAIALIMSMLGLNSMPVFALQGNKVLKTQVTEYKFDYINLDWWKDYNDEYLEGYVLKAITGNQDLQIATLKVEEARQQMKLQFSKELPSATIGASPALLKSPGVSNTEGLFAFPVIVSYEADIFLKNRDKTSRQGNYI